MKKYTYYKVIQQNWGTGWDDVDFYETNSSYLFDTRDERQRFLENLKLYRTEEKAPVRVIKRKELNTITV